MYPKAKYHATLPVVCVYSAEEEKVLGDGWYDYPHQVLEALAKPKPVPEEPKRSPGRPKLVKELPAIDSLRSDS